jgi:hypothetical protein
MKISRRLKKMNTRKRNAHLALHLKREANGSNPNVLVATTVIQPRNALGQFLSPNRAFSRVTSTHATLAGSVIRKGNITL